MTDSRATLDFTRPVLAEVQNAVVALQPVLKNAVESSSEPAWCEVDQRLKVIADTLTLANLQGARLLVEEMQAVAATRPGFAGSPEAHRADQRAYGIADTDADTDIASADNQTSSAQSDAADETHPQSSAVNLTDAQYQLPAAANAFIDYVDFLLAGNADRVPALVPFVNNLRACRHEPLLSETVVAADVFGVRSSLDVDRAAVEVLSQLNAEMRKVRLPLMQSILQICRTDESTESQRKATETVVPLLERLQQASTDDLLEPLERLWSLVQAVCLSITDSSLAIDTAIRQLLVQFERYLGTLQETLDGLTARMQTTRQPIADDAMQIALPDRLVRNLLYYTAYSQSQHPQVVAVREHNQLSQLLPHSAAVAPAQKLSRALDRSIVDNLMREVKDAQALLDEHAETGLKTQQQLRETATHMQQVAAGFLLLGEYGSEQQSRQVAVIIEEIAELPDPEQMQQLATELLLLQERLSQLQEDGGRMRLFAGSSAGLSDNKNNQATSNRATSFSELNLSERNLSAFSMDRTITHCVEEARAQLASLENFYLDHYEIALEDLAAREQPDLHIAGNDGTQDAADETLSETAVVVRAPEKRASAKSGSLGAHATAMERAAQALMIIPLPEASPPLAIVSRYLRWCDEQSDDKVATTAVTAAVTADMHVAFADLVVNLSHYLDATIRGQAVAGDLLQNTEVAMQWLEQVLDNENETLSGSTDVQAYNPALIRSPYRAQTEFDVDAEDTGANDREGSNSISERPLHATGAVSDRSYLTGDFDSKANDSTHGKGLDSRYTSIALSHFGELNEHFSTWRQSRDPAALHALQDVYRALEQVSSKSGAADVAELCKANRSLLRQSSDEPSNQDGVQGQSSINAAVTDRLLQESIATLPQLLNDTYLDDPAVARPSADDESVLTGLLQRLESATTRSLDSVEFVGSQEKLQDKFLDDTLALTNDGTHDSTLFDVFRHECAGHLATLNGVVDAAVRSGTDVPVSNRFARTLHTLNGSALTAEETGIASLAAALESRIESYRRTSTALTHDEWLHINAAIDQLAEVLNARQSGVGVEAVDNMVKPVIAKLNSMSARGDRLEHNAFDSAMDVSDNHDYDDTDALESRTVDIPANLQSNDSAASGATGFSAQTAYTSKPNQALFLTFIDEADQILRKLQNMHGTLSGSGVRAHQVLRDGLRQLHTLKGSARVAGCEPMAVLAHQIENHWLGWRHDDAGFNVKRQDLFLASVDALQINLEQARSGQPMGDFNLLLEELIQDREQLGDEHSVLATRNVGSDPLELSADDNLTADAFATTDAIDSTRDLSSDTDKTLIDELETTLENTAESTASMSRESMLFDAGVDGPGNAEAIEAFETNRPGSEIDQQVLSRLHSLATRISLQQGDLHQGLSLLRDNLLDLDKSSVMLRQKLRELDLETSVVPAVPGHSTSATHNASLDSSSHSTSPADYSPDQNTDRFKDEVVDRTTERTTLATAEDSRQLSEVLHDLDTIRDALHERLRHEEETLAQTSRLASEIHETVLSARLVRFDTLTHRLQSVVRQAGRALQKEVSFRISGGDASIDRDIHAQLAAPLEHLLRNAVVHGIENPQQRRALGKPPVGLVQVNVSVSGNYLDLDIKDDGGGVDFERLRELSGDNTLDVQTLLARLPQLGQSTRGHTDELAGRGVGLGTVNQSLSQLDGTLQFKSSDPGGTSIHVRIPLQVQLQRAVVFTLGATDFAVPAEFVSAVRTLPSSIESASAVQMFDSYPPYDLRRLLGMEARSSNAYPGTARQLLENTLSPPRVILMAHDGQRFSLQPDHLVGFRDLVTRPPGRQLASLGIYSGVSLQSDGRQVMVLDARGLMKNFPLDSPADNARPGAAANTTTSRVTDTETALYSDDPDDTDALALNDSGEPLSMDDTQQIPAQAQSHHATRLFVDTLDFGKETAAARRQLEANKSAGDVSGDIEPCVMIVDDSVTLRTYTRDIVTSVGGDAKDKRLPFRSIEARDGLEALQALKHMDHPPALLIVDVEMPRMDGFQLVAALRKIERYTKLPVVMISSRTGNSYRHRAAKLGVVAYLGKPYQAEELTGIMQSLGLSNKQQQEPAIPS